MGSDKTNEEAIITELTSKLDEAQADMENIQNAIAEKGADITDETPTSEYAEYIEQITGTTDEELSETSTNPVQNKVVTAALNNIDHSKLIGCDKENLHPMKSITGLKGALDKKMDDVPALSNSEIEEIINSFV